MKKYFHLFLFLLVSCVPNKEPINEEPAFTLLENITKPNYSKQIETGFKNIDASCGGLDKQHYLICREYDSLKNIYHEYGISEYGQKYRIMDSISDGKVIDSKRFYYGFESVNNVLSNAILNQMPISENTLFENVIYSYDSQNSLIKTDYYTRTNKAKYIFSSDISWRGCERYSLPSVKTDYLDKYMLDSMYLYQIAIFRKDIFLNEERTMKYVFSKDFVEMNKLNLSSVSIYPNVKFGKQINIYKKNHFGKDTLDNGSIINNDKPLDSVIHQKIVIDSCPLKYDFKTEKIKYGKSVWIIFD